MNKIFWIGTGAIISLAMAILLESYPAMKWVQFGIWMFVLGYGVSLSFGKHNKKDS